MPDYYQNWQQQNQPKRPYPEKEEKSGGFLDFLSGGWKRATTRRNTGIRQPLEMFKTGKKKAPGSFVGQTVKSGMDAFDLIYERVIPTIFLETGGLIASPVLQTFGIKAEDIRKTARELFHKSMGKGTVERDEKGGVRVRFVGKEGKVTPFNEVFSDYAREMYNNPVLKRTIPDWARFASVVGLSSAYASRFTVPFGKAVKTGVKGITKPLFISKTKTPLYFDELMSIAKGSKTKLPMSSNKMAAYKEFVRTDKGKSFLQKVFESTIKGKGKTATYQSPTALGQKLGVKPEVKLAPGEPVFPLTTTGQQAGAPIVPTARPVVPPVPKTTVPPVAPLAQVTPKVAPTIAKELQPLAKEMTPLQIVVAAKKAGIPPSKMKGLLTEKKPTQITKPEDVLLRERLRQQAMGARAGYKEGAKVTRENILQNLRVTQKNISGIKKNIVEYAKKLPVSERGKYLVAVKNTETQANLAKVFTRMDNAIETVAKKNVVKEVRDIVAKTIKNKNVDITYQKYVADALDGLEFKGKTANTLKRLVATDKFIQNQVAMGNNVELPVRVLNELQRLNKVSIKGLSLPELEVLRDKIQHLEKLGGTKQAAKDVIYNAEKEQIEKEVLPSIVPMESNTLITGTVGEKLPPLAKMKNKFRSMRNFAEARGKALLPMDVIFDMIDGANGSYGGAIFKNFKKRLDLDFKGYLDLKDEMKLGVNTYAAEKKISAESMDRIGVVLARNQVGGIEKLLGRGMTEEEIQNIKLTPSEEGLRSIMRKDLDKLRPLVARFMQDVYNKPLGLVEEYFPFVTDLEALSDLEISNKFGHYIDENITLKTKTVKQGFTKERKGGGEPIKINALEVFNDHVDNVAYLLNMGKDVKMLSEVANKPEFEKSAGDMGTNLVREWLDLVARKGGVENGQTMKWLDVMRGKVGMGVLGFKLSSAMIQPTALLDGAGLIGARAFQGMSSVITKPGVRDFILKNMPEIRNRIGDDPAFLDFQNSKLGKAAFWGLQTLDKNTAMGISWGAYLKKLKQLKVPLDLTKPNKEALDFAQLVVRRTQASPSFKDTPLAISAGKFTGNRSVDKILFQFQTFLLNRWSNFYYDGLKTGLFSKKNIGDNPFSKSAKLKGAQIIMWLTLATLAAVGIRRGIKGVIKFLTGNETEEQDSYTKDVVQEAVSNVPVVGPLASAITYESSPVPLLQLGENALNGINRLITSKTGDARARGIIKLLQSLGGLKGIPGSAQIGELLRNFVPYEPSGSSKTKSSTPSRNTPSTGGGKYYQSWKKQYGKQRKN